MIFPDPTPVELAEILSRGLLRDYYETFTTDAGKRVLLDLERKHYVGRTTAARPALGLPIDPYDTAHREGQRMVVLEIKAQIAKAQLGTPEPGQTHATATLAKEP